jgi:hypothetical protein
VDRKVNDHPNAHHIVLIDLVMSNSQKNDIEHTSSFREHFLVIKSKRNHITTVHMHISHSIGPNPYHIVPIDLVMSNHQKNDTNQASSFCEHFLTIKSKINPITTVYIHIGHFISSNALSSPATPACTSGLSVPARS